MDKNYLDNLDGSHHIDEGMFDRLKARGAAGIQRYKGIAGTGWQPIEEAKIESLWNSLKKKVSRLIKDFNANVLPNIQKNRPDDILANQKTINYFNSLIRKLNLGTPDEVDTPVDVSESGLGDVIHEAGLGKFFRPWGINQALATNDTKTALNAYRSQIKKLYSEFVNDVQRVTKTPPGFVGRNIISHKPDWSDILNTIEKVAGVPESNSASASPDVPTDSDDSEETGLPSEPTGTSAVPVSTSPAATGGETPSPLLPDKKSSSISSDSNFLDEDELEQVINIIIKRVRSDARSDRDPHKYMSTPISSWKTGHEYNIPDDGEGEPSEPEEVTEEDAAASSKPEEKRGFLYRFRQLYRKHTGSFVIKMGVFKLHNKVYEVIWHSYGEGGSGHGHNNDIIVKIYDSKNPKAAPNSIKVFGFYDHEVDPRIDVSKYFSLERLIKRVNPDINIDSKLLNSMKGYTEELHRALFAVTDRKSLELKPVLSVKGKKAYVALVEAGWDKIEAEDFIDEAEKSLPPTATVEQIITQAEILFKGGTPESIKNKKDAVGILIAVNKMKEKEATKHIEVASNKLGFDATVKELVALALKKPSPEVKPVKPEVKPVKPIKPKIEPEVEPVVNPPKNTIEQRLEKLNLVLTSKGIQTLDNISQMNRLNAIKGGNKSKNPGKTPSADNKELWVAMVAKAKGEVAPIPKKKKPLSNLEEGLIDPFVRSNFY